MTKEERFNEIDKVCNKLKESHNEIDGKNEAYWVFAVNSEEEGSDKLRMTASCEGDMSLIAAMLYHAASRNPDIYSTMKALVAMLDKDREQNFAAKRSDNN